MRNKALVVGSVAFDVIFSVHNTLKDEIIVKDGKISDVSMMLTAQNKEVFYGGTGGNIAYGLGIQGMHPYLFSVVGDDFNHDYRPHLENHSVQTKIVEKEGEYTATFYGISDAAKEQIGIFQPNTHGDYMDKISLSDTLSQEDFDRISIAIFSPGTGQSMKKHMEEFREKAGMEPTVLFDPSQVLSIFFDEPLLRECIELADIFIGNETEVQQLQDMLNMNTREVLNLGLKYVIETKGKEGSVIHAYDGGTYSVPIVDPEAFVEQTGAGDAYRAGMIKGMLEGLSIENSCRVGALLASKNVEAEGGQNYRL